MTVKELINKLQSLPPRYQNAQVVTIGEQDPEEITKIEILYDDQINLIREYF